MGEVVIILMLSIVASIMAGQLIVWLSERYFGVSHVEKTPATICGRVHLGPVAGHQCKACLKTLTEADQLAYWKTKRAAVECQRRALLGANTK